MPRPPTSSTNPAPSMGEGEATAGGGQAPSVQPGGEAQTRGATQTRADTSGDQRALAEAGEARKKAEEALEAIARQEKLLRDRIQKEENDREHEAYLRGKEERNKADDKYQEDKAKEKNRREKAQAAELAEADAKRSREAARARAPEQRQQAERPIGGKGRGRNRSADRGPKKNVVLRGVAQHEGPVPIGHWGSWIPNRLENQTPPSGFNNGAPREEPPKGRPGIWYDEKTAIMYLRGEREGGTYFPRLLTGSTRTILDRGTPPPLPPGEEPWLVCRWDALPDEVFMEIPGDVPGYEGLDWPASDAGLIPPAPQRLDPCHWGGPPNQVWLQWRFDARRREMGFEQQRRYAEDTLQSILKSAVENFAAWEPDDHEGRSMASCIPFWCKWDGIMPKWQAWDPRTIRYAKEQLDSNGKRWRRLQGARDLLESNLDIYILEGRAEQDDPFVVVVCPGLDAVARRRFRDKSTGRWFWESCSPPEMFKPTHPYMVGLLAEQRRQLLWRWPLLKDRLPAAENLHYGANQSGTVPACGQPRDAPVGYKSLRPPRVSDTERQPRGDHGRTMSRGRVGDDQGQGGGIAPGNNPQGGPPRGEQREPTAPPAAHTHVPAGPPGHLVGGDPHQGEVPIPPRTPTPGQSSGLQKEERTEVGGPNQQGGATPGRAAGADGPVGGAASCARRPPGAPCWRTGTPRRFCPGEANSGESSPEHNGGVLRHPTERHPPGENRSG